MEGYHNAPRIDPIPGNMFELAEDFIYEWEKHGVPQRLTIGAGFPFDGASIPEAATFLTWLLPFFKTIRPMGMHIYAALVHDYIFMYRGMLPKGAHKALVNGQWMDAHHKWTFTQANKLFARMLREDGVRRRERRAMFLAVQSPIGYISWKTGDLPPDARENL